VLPPPLLARLSLLSSQRTQAEAGAEIANELNRLARVVPREYQPAHMALVIRQVEALALLIAAHGGLADVVRVDTAHAPRHPARTFRARLYAAWTAFWA
jgi:hypothetical protein